MTRHPSMGPSTNGETKLVERCSPFDRPGTIERTPMSASDSLTSFERGDHYFVVIKVYLT